MNVLLLSRVFRAVRHIYRLLGWRRRERAEWEMEERTRELVSAMTCPWADLVALGRMLIVAGWQFDEGKWLSPGGRSSIAGPPEMILLAVRQRMIEDGWQFDGKRWVE
mgnify:CR=1 FL=1